MLQNLKNWYVFYTYPKYERMISDQLQKQDYESFLPLHWVVRQWSDRKKRLHVPLFPNYIFVNIELNRIYEILKIPKVISVVRFNGIPAFLRGGEISTIKYMVKSDYSLELDSNFNVGDSVIISRGALQGMQGTLIKNGGKDRFIIEIESIKQTVIVNVSAEMMETIQV